MEFEFDDFELSEQTKQFQSIYILSDRGKNGISQLTNFLMEIKKKHNS